MAKNLDINQSNSSMDPMERLSKIKIIQSRVSDIKDDIRSGVIDRMMLAKAVMDPKNVKFSKGSKATTVRIKFENGIVKEYELYSVIDVMQAYIRDSIIGPLSSFRLAYLHRYDPNFKIPENVNKEDFAREIGSVNKTIEIATKERIEYEGLEHIDDEERENIRKEAAERLIIESFLSAFLVINSYGNTFKMSPLEQKIAKYVDGTLDFCVQIAKECNWVDEDMGAACLSMIFRKESTDFYAISDVLNIKPLTDDEVIRFMERYITQEEFEQFITNMGECFIDHRKVVKYLTSPSKNKDSGSKAGIMTFDEFKAKISKKYLVEMFRYTKNKDVLQYMLPEQLITVYLEGLVADWDFQELIGINEILDSSVSPENKVKAIERCSRVGGFIKDMSEKVWSMLESGDLTIEDTKKLENLGCLKIERVIKQYKENKKRMIAEELDETPQISDEKLLAYFTPDIIIREFDKDKNDDVQDFIRETVKEMYEKKDLSMEEAITSELVNGDKEKLTEKCLLLYKSGDLSFDIFKKIGLSREEAFDLCRDNLNDEQLVIDMFNSSLVSQDDIIELLGDDFERIVFDYIKKGMSAKIIEGYYSTSQLIEMTRESHDEDGNEIPAKLTYENLVEVKSDIEIGIDEKGMSKKGKNRTSLLDLYLSDRLSYSELYDLVKANVISIDAANMINEKYNLIKDWDKLKEKGVTGKSILDMTGPMPGPGPISSGDVVGIDEGCIIDLYIAMGAKEYLEIDAKKCPVFKDYIIIPIIEKKVAYLEGKDGRTYIVPLKIVLEQINNPNGQMDLIGNARSRKEFNRQKAHIRSANHTRNWGRSVVQKTADLPSVPMSKEDAKEFISTHYGIICAIEKSYDTRKLAMIKRNNGHQNP